VSFDFERGEAVIGKKRVALTPMEASVFGVLIKSRRPMNTPELASKVYGGQEPDSSYKCIHIYIRRLREKTGLKIPHRREYGYEVRP